MTKEEAIYGSFYEDEDQSSI